MSYLILVEGHEQLKHSYLSFVDIKHVLSDMLL